MLILLFQFIYSVFRTVFLYGCFMCRLLYIYCDAFIFLQVRSLWWIHNPSVWKWINVVLCFYFNCFNRGNSLRRFKNGSKWRTKEISIDGKPPTFSSSSAAAAAANRNSANLSTTELSPALLAQANWTFVEKLLKVSVISSNMIYSSDLIYFNSLWLLCVAFALNRIAKAKQNECS